MGLKIDRRAQKITKVLGIIALATVILCMLKILIWEHSYYQNKSSEERSPEQAVITDLADAVAPGETKPSVVEYQNYQVSANAPRYLEIPRLEVSARVKDSNVNEHTLPLPENIYDVSWYSGSSRPGENGNILISGISEGATAHGVFANLDSLENGDEVILERGDGERYTYEIKEVSIIDKADAANKLPTAQKRLEDKETLTLITGRRANENSNSFNSVIIVRATKK
jgi:LPXTG-site transpeptidase (sortase) family protein